MVKRLVVPDAFRHVAEAAGMSPAIRSGDHLFLTGMTGSDPDGHLSADPEEQFRRAFAKIGAILEADGLGFEAVVEMTSYHVELREHFELFDAVRREIFGPPHPAWTAVEVAGLRRAGALVEIRVIAAAGGGG